MSDLSPHAFRDEFAIPRDIAYFNAAAVGAHPYAAIAAGEDGIAARAAVWTIDRARLEAQAEQLRSRAALLIGAEPDDIAIVGSVAHGIATAAHNLAVAPGTRILRLAGEHPSMALAWDALAQRSGAVVEAVARPADGDWTSAIADAIDRRGGAPIAVAALTGCHWTDGALVDLAMLAPRVRATGAALVVDATQQVGVAPIDLAEIDPDFLVFPCFKWLLGPYGIAFLYAARRRQTGAPLDPNGFNMLIDPLAVATGPAIAARRYDRGQRHDPVGFAMALAAIDQILDWGIPAIAGHVARTMMRIAEGVSDLDFDMLPQSYRVGHILGLRRPGGTAAQLVRPLAEAGVYVSERQGALRISPHIYNDEQDVQRLIAVLRDL